jgi:protein-S-isoprenylcysteine O-methyltransferase Ste14
MSSNMRWMVAQAVLMVAIVVSWSAWPPVPQGMVVEVLGWVFIAIGVVVAAAARIEMGSSFTPSPTPKARGALVTGGPFRLVRNPFYLGLLLCFAGGSLERSWVGFGLTVLLGILWAAKVRVEEEQLASRFPAYAEYKERVRYRLIPFVY